MAKKTKAGAVQRPVEKVETQTDKPSRPWPVIVLTLQKMTKVLARFARAESTLAVVVSEYISVSTTILQVGVGTN